MGNEDQVIPMIIGALETAAPKLKKWLPDSRRCRKTLDISLSRKALPETAELSGRGLGVEDDSYHME